MLIRLGRLGLSIEVEPLSHYYRQGYNFSCAARLSFEEIPERGALELFDPLPDRNSESSNCIVSGFANNGHDREDCNSFVSELANHGHAHEVLKSFVRMNGFGIKPTKFTLCTVLNSCAKELNWHMGLQIHARIIQIGYGENLFLSSALIDLYAKCEAVLDARRVFDSVKRHDHVSWTSIISGFSHNGRGREAFMLFKEMLGTEIRPNCFTYASLISACTGLEEEAFEQGTLLHTHVIELGFKTNSFVISSLIDCYAKCGRIDQAILLFDATTERDSVLINSMISGYSRNLLGEEALKLFAEMRSDKLSPTDYTFASILNACGSLTVLQQGRQVHSLVTKMGSEQNVFVVSSLIDMYSKCGGIDEARCVFDQTIEKNSVLWTSMITGYAQSGRGQDGLELFDLLVTEEGVIPDHLCFTAVLTACNHAGFLDRGIEYFDKMRKDYGLIPELDQYACMIHLYARNGHLRKAKELMKEMPFNPNAVIWSSFLASCRLYGEVELGREAANQLFKMKPHNAAPYVTMANLYAEAGIWGEVAGVRKLMKQVGVRKSAGWSWVEVDKRVHVFSVGDTSHPRSQEIYMELDKLNLEMKEAGYMPILKYV